MTKTRKKKPAKKSKVVAKPAAPLPPATTLTSVGPFRLTPSGMTVVGSPTFEQWEAAVKVAKSLSISVMWIVGDLLVYGEERFGEDYAQAVEEADYADDTVRVAQWVAKRFPPDKRILELTFSHHQAVAVLDSEPAAKILATALKEKLSTRDVRALAKATQTRETPAIQAFSPVGRITNQPEPRPPESGDALTDPPEPVDEGKQFVGEVETLCRDVDQIAERLKALKESKFSYSIHVDSALQQIQAARSTLWQGRPAHVCPYCKGEGCKPCAQTGRVKMTSLKAGKEAVG